MNNLSSYCGLVDAKIRASDKDLPVQNPFASVVTTYYAGSVLKDCWNYPLANVQNAGDGLVEPVEYLIGSTPNYGISYGRNS